MKTVSTFYGTFTDRQKKALDECVKQLAVEYDKFVFTNKEIYTARKHLKRIAAIKRESARLNSQKGIPDSAGCYKNDYRFIGNYMNQIPTIVLRELCVKYNLVEKEEDNGKMSVKIVDRYTK